MATDLLIARVGTRRRRAGAGDGRPPRPGQHDAVPDDARAVLGRLGQARPARAVEERGPAPQARAQLLEQTNSRPYQPDPARTHTPASAYGAEWYGNAADICRVHAALQAAADGAAAPVTRHPVRDPRHRPRHDEVAVHRREGRKPARRLDIQLVRRRPHAVSLGGQLPAELAAVPQPDRRRLAAVDRQAGVRARCRAA